MKKLTSAIVASSLVLGLVGTVGATTPDKVQTAADRMLKLHLINGVTPGTTDLALSANLTRAQLVTILVRAFGQEGNAKYLNGAAAFPDTATHPWASGYIAMAKRIIADRTGGKEVVGMPDGTFNPDGNVTAAEAVAFLMKFVGAPKDDSLAWPDNYIQGAATAGLITAEDKAVLLGEKNSPATRGLAFYLADRTFYGYKLAEGGTTYTTFVDNVKPTVTVDAVPATTLEDKVIVTGTVTDDTVAVYVGTIDNPATIANGKFTATVNLKVGDNSILVHAVDLAGNPSEQTVKVSRTVGNAASIEAADITVAAGGTADVKAVVKDAKGNEIAGATVTAESTVGTFADGKFTAGTKAGEGKLTLKVGELTKDVKVTVTAGALAKVGADKASVAPGEMVTLTAQDQYGNAITSGVTFSQTSPDAFLDGSTGKFIASKAGSYTVTAKAGDATATGTIGVFGAISKVALVAPDALVPNESTEYELKVNVTDAKDNVVSSYKDLVTVSTDLAIVGSTADATTGKYSTTILAKNGVATFKVTAPSGLKNSEVDVDITASNGTNEPITGTGTVNVTSQVATSLKLSSPKYLAVNDGVAGGVIYVLDQTGESMVDGSWDVTLSANALGKLSALGAVKSDATTSITVPAVGSGTPFLIWSTDATQLGTINVTAAYTGFTTVTGTTTAAYGLAESKLALTQLTTAPVMAAEQEVYQLKLQIQDKNGVPRFAVAGGEQFTLNFDTTSLKEIHVATSNSSTALTAAEVLAGTTPDSTTGNVTVTVGEYRSSVYVNVVAKKLTGTVNVKASGGGLTASSSSVAFKAGDANSVAFTRTGAVNVLKGSNITTKLTAQVTDAEGNKVAQSGVKVKFTPSNKSYVKLNGSAVDSVEAVTDNNGQATADVTLIPGSSDTTVSVDIDANNDGTYDDKGTNLALNLQDVVTNSITASTYVTRGTTTPITTKTSSFAAGETVEIRATAKDNNGNTIDGTSAIDLAKTLQLAGLAGDGKDIDETIDTLNSSDTTWTWNNAGYFETHVTAAKAGSFSFNVVDGGVAADVKSAARSITIAAGAPNHLVLAEETDKAITVDTGKVKAFTVRVADIKGNLVSADKITGAVGFTVDFADAGITAAAAGTYYEVRVGSESGRTVGQGEVLTISAARNSYTIYVLTNDPDTATLTLTPAATVTSPALPGTAESIKVNVNQ